MLTFCFDRVANEYTGYPNLAHWRAEPYTPEWRQYDAHWPNSVPLRLLMYFYYNSIPYRVVAAEQAESAWYPIALGWFNFDCDYLELIPKNTLERIQQGKIKILFYYHEGDNPYRIKDRIDLLCNKHQLSLDSYVFISANSAAESIDRFIYFPDHEFFFRHLNRKQSASTNNPSRSFEFTLLSRTHKWWRASCVYDLLSFGLLSNSLWSYHTQVDLMEDPADNPIELDLVEGWRSEVERFVQGGPYVCDHFSSSAQNDHHYVNQDLYNQSFFHIVLETHFDADQSNATFITEKTYKAIKYGQPFVVVGPPGTLKQLKQDGYCVFDDVLDCSYDLEINNTQRWFKIKKLISDIRILGAEKLFQQCQPGIEHNQQMFLTRAVEPLNSLQRKLLCLKE